MQHSLQYGVIALMLLGGATFVTAQEEKTQQNSADEALVKSAPEAKDPPQAPPQTAPSPQASQPGLASQEPVLVDGKLAVPGAAQDAQTAPAKFSAKNDAIDKTPIMAYPPPLTDEQKRAIYQQVSQGQVPVANVDAKPAQQLPASTALQELPADLREQIPAVSDYKFLRLQDKVLLVNPRESIVVGEITK